MSDHSKQDAAAVEAMSVSELTGHIKAVIEGTFPSVWVAGEISDLSRPRSGHVYLTLKDDDSQIRGIIWRSTASRLGIDLQDGEAVLCFGDLEVYAARGSYQLVIRKIRQQGVARCNLLSRSCERSSTPKVCSRRNGRDRCHGFPDAWP